MKREGKMDIFVCTQLIFVINDSFSLSPRVLSAGSITLWHALTLGWAAGNLQSDHCHLVPGSTMCLFERLHLPFTYLLTQNHIRHSWSAVAWVVACRVGVCSSCWSSSKRVKSSQSHAVVFSPVFTTPPQRTALLNALLWEANENC